MSSKQYNSVQSQSIHTVNPDLITMYKNISTFRNTDDFVVIQNIDINKYSARNLALLGKRYLIPFGIYSKQGTCHLASIINMLYLSDSKSFKDYSYYFRDMKYGGPQIKQDILKLLVQEYKKYLVMLSNSSNNQLADNINTFIDSTQHMDNESFLKEFSIWTRANYDIRNKLILFILEQKTGIKYQITQINAHSPLPINQDFIISCGPHSIAFRNIRNNNYYLVIDEGFIFKISKQDMTKFLDLVTEKKTYYLFTKT